jgi:hypothetical protein
MERYSQPRKSSDGSHSKKRNLLQCLLPTLRTEPKNVANHTGTDVSVETPSESKIREKYARFQDFWQEKLS